VTENSGCAWLQVSVLAGTATGGKLPNGIKCWSLTSLQQRLMKTGGRLIKHARYHWLLGSAGKSAAARPEH
jgi:hypothetical protein